MKVLLATLEYKPFKGGVAEYYSALFDKWPNKDIYVLAPEADEKINESSRVIRRKMIHKYFSWLPLFFIIAKELKKNKINYILVGQILPIGTAVWFLSLIFRFRYGVILHGMDYTYAKKRPRKRFLSKLILSRAEHLIVGNTYLKKKINQDSKSLDAKTLVVNPGIHSENFRLHTNSELTKKYNGKFVLYFIGRLVERKGVDRVLKAIEMLDRSRYRDIVFLIAGFGPQEDYLKSISNDDRVTFLGKISDNQKWAYLGLCDVFITTSREIDGDFEGFGIVYLEANQQAKPVIACKSGGVTDSVVSGLNGILLENDNPDNIKEAIIKLYEDRELKNDLGRQGQKRAKNFLWEKQIYKIYKYISK